MREKALEYATRLCGPAWGPDLDVEAAVLPIADVFERWLARDRAADLTGAAYDLQLADRLHEAYATIIEARIRSRHSLISDGGLERIRSLADDLDPGTVLDDG